MKKNKVPIRQCCATLERFPKQDMIRVVKNKEGIITVDPTGKQNGRGAYIAKQKAAIDKAVKNKCLEKKLEAKIPDEIYSKLYEMIGN